MTSPRVSTHHPVDIGGMGGKDALHADAVRNLAHRKAGSGEGAPLPDDYPFKDLNPFLVAFDDADVHFHGIPGAKGGQIPPHLLPAS